MLISLDTKTQIILRDYEICRKMLHDQFDILNIDQTKYVGQEAHSQTNCVTTRVTTNQIVKESSTTENHLQMALELIASVYLVLKRFLMQLYIGNHKL